MTPPPGSGLPSEKPKAWTDPYKAERHIWGGMRSRCNNPANKRFMDYGGRGIRVCDRWNDPVTGMRTFIADMGRRPSLRHSIDRIDGNKGYSPENCRWASPQEQQRNRTNNIWLTWRGETRTVIEWIELLGLPESRTYNRIKSGWAVEDLLTKPSHVRLTAEQKAEIRRVRPIGSPAIQAVADRFGISTRHVRKISPVGVRRVS